MSPYDRAKARENALRKRGNPEATKRANRIKSRFLSPAKRGLNRAYDAGYTARRQEYKRLVDGIDDDDD